MIMDAIPSPQSVGREFVRQYYTLLNKAPDHLHRFYNNNSSFVHGGLDPHNREATMVIGQKQIYNKIQQLRFRDCHAKISQVDAQSTLGSGVVVQVTGELSNNGEPMRRFTQTFVLAAQSPKKYYVHNDIFRYQDLISDDEVEVESRSEHDEQEQEQDAGAGIVVVENNNQTNNVMSAQQQPQQPIYYPLATVQSYQQPQPTQLNGVGQHDEIIQNLTPTNNNIAVSNNVNNNAPIPVPSQTLSTQQQTIPVEQMASVGTSTNATNNDLENVSITALQNDIENQQTDVIIDQASPEVELNDESTVNENESINVTDEDVPALKPTQSEPKTYAQFFKSENFSSGINFVSTNTNSGRTPTNNTYASRATQPDLRSDTSPNALSSSRSAASRPGQIRERRSSNANQFSDNHQLFLGNVPHHATEEELKIMFGRFGTVVDLRIHSKSGPKIPGMRAPQNYGFITYDDPESVQNCLSNMPLYYPENSPDGQKLNVEEKKARMRNENSGNIDRNDRDRNDRGLGRTISGGGGQRNSGDRDGPRNMGMNRGAPNAGGMLRSGGPSGGNTQRSSAPGGRPFNRNERQQGGPRGNNNNGTSNTSASAGNGGGGYARR